MIPQRVIVIDTGIGIKEEDRDSIFTALFTTKAKGTGLGLAVCRRVVNAHGGRIWFETETGVGTEFHIEIPSDRAFESLHTHEEAVEIVEARIV